MPPDGLLHLVVLITVLAIGTIPRLSGSKAFVWAGAMVIVGTSQTARFLVQSVGGTSWPELVSTVSHYQLPLWVLLGVWVYLAIKGLKADFIICFIVSLAAVTLGADLLVQLNPAEKTWGYLALWSGFVFGLGLCAVGSRHKIILPIYLSWFAFHLGLLSYFEYFGSIL